MKRTNALVNSTIGIAGLIVFTLSVIGSVALLLSPRQEVPYEKLRSEAVDACQRETQQAGFVVVKNPGSIEAKLFGLDDYEKKMLSSSLAIQACQNMQMTQFCMGECKDSKGSPIRGLTFTMSYFDPALR